MLFEVFCWHFPHQQGEVLDGNNVVDFWDSQKRGVQGFIKPKFIDVPGQQKIN